MPGTVGAPRPGRVGRRTQIRSVPRPAAWLRSIARCTRLTRQADGAPSASGHNGLVTRHMTAGLRVPRAARPVGRARGWLLESEPRARPGRFGLLVDAALAVAATISVLVTIGKTHGCEVISPFTQCLGPIPVPPRAVHHLPIAIASAMTAAPLVLRRIRPLTGVLADRGRSDHRSQRGR